MEQCPPVLHHLYLVCETEPADDDGEGQSQVLIRRVSIRVSTLAAMAEDGAVEGGVVWASMSVHSGPDLEVVAPALIREWDSHGWGSTDTRVSIAQEENVRVNAMVTFWRMMARFFSGGQLMGM
jgi:hypothetical protein